jgi:hypothetical protein
MITPYVLSLQQPYHMLVGTGRVCAGWEQIHGCEDVMGVVVDISEESSGEVSLQLSDADLLMVSLDVELGSPHGGHSSIPRPWDGQMGCH